MVSNVRLGALDPNDLAGKNLTTSFRGFDQQQVRELLARLTAEMAASAARESQLRDRLVEAEARAVPPVLGEAELHAALGKEAGRVLTAAHEAAAEIRAKAQEATDTLQRDAEKRTSQARHDAEMVLGDRSREAEETAAAIRGEAERQAAAEVEKAQDRGREMLAEAQAVRERVLADLARRRLLVHTQVEQLRAGRNRLLEAYAVVRSTLEEATQELSVAEAEARAKAQATASDPPPEPGPPIAELEAEMTVPPSPAGAGGAHVADEEAEPGPGAEGGGEPARGPVAEPEPVAVAPESEPAAEPVVVEPEPEAVEAVVVEPLAEPAAVEPEPEPAVEAVAEPAVESVAEPAVEAAAEAVAEPAVEVPKSQTEHESAGADLAAEPAPVPREPGGETGPVPGQPGQDQGPANSADELFARIRASRAQAVVHAEAVLAEPPSGAFTRIVEPQPETEPQPAASGPAESGPAASDDAGEGIETAFERRDAEVKPFEQALLRVVKRALADEQNRVLDAVRRHGTVSGLDDLLPAGEAHVAYFVDIVLPVLGAAAEAGAGGSQDLTPAVDDLAVDLGAEVVGDLRERLGRAIDDHEAGAGIAEAAAAAYRRWRTSRAEPAARHHVLAAYHRGRFEAAPEGSWRWVVEPTDGGCPDCDDNALAGPTPKGEPFPTGAFHPPAHDGCGCVVVPATVEPAAR